MTITTFLIKHIMESVHDINQLDKEGYLKDKMNWVEKFSAEMALIRIKAMRQIREDKGLN